VKLGDLLDGYLGNIDNNNKKKKEKKKENHFFEAFTE
jgi:hypothetical protein